MSGVNPFEGDGYGYDTYSPNMTNKWAPSGPSFSSNLYEDLLRGRQQGISTRYHCTRYNPDYIPENRKPIANPNFRDRVDDINMRGVCYKPCDDAGKTEGMTSTTNGSFDEASATIKLDADLLIIFMFIVFIFIVLYLGKSIKMLTDKIDKLRA